jgi:uncharacterized protein (DUF58 family)
MDAGRSDVSAWPALGVALVGALMMFTGLAIAGPALSVPGAGLLALGVLAPLWVLAASRRVHLEAHPLDETVTDGQALRLEVSLDSGRARLGLGDGLLSHELAKEPLPLNARALARGERVVLQLQARGRGRRVLDSPRLVLNDPLGLARAGRAGGGRAGAVLVLPATEPVRWVDDNELNGVSGASSGMGAGIPTIDIAGLRAYQPGTPATRIHWPALARGGDLLERVFVTEAELAPVIVVDPRTADPARLEAVIRAAASLTLALAHRASVDLALPGRGTPLRVSSTLSAWPTALRALALLEATEPDSVGPRLPPGGGVLFYACTDPALAAAARGHWAGRLLTLSPQPAGLAAPGAVLEVAACAAWPLRSRG